MNMTSYRTSMREALKEVWGLEEKFSSAQIAQLKKAFEPMRGKKISMKSSEKLRGILDKVADDKETLLALLKANIPFVSRGAATRLIDKHNMKGAEINKLMASYNVEEFELEEEVELDEALKPMSDDELTGMYHSAIKWMERGMSQKESLKKLAKEMCVTIKETAAVKKKLDNAGFKEEVDLDEDIGALIFGGGIIAALLPVLFMAVREIIRGTPLESSIKKIVDKLKKNKNYKMSDSEKSDVKGFVSKVKKEKPSLLQKAMKKIKEEVELDEVFDFVLLDKDNKIARRYSGSNAKKDAESGKKSAHLPPMSIPKGDVKKMKIVPIAPKDKKGIGDTVLAIGEKLDKEDEPKVKEIIKKLKGASQAHAGQAKDLEKAVKEDSKPINEILPVLARMVAKPIARKVATKAVSKKDESAASDARRAMASDPSTKQKFSKNVSATDDDVKAADKNIIMQMRKAVSLRGNKVEFMDKKKVMIPQKIAQAVIAKYNNMKKPADKEKFQSKISKSYKSMLATLKEQNEINNKNNSLDQLKELVKEMKGKNNG